MATITALVSVAKESTVDGKTQEITSDVKVAVIRPILLNDNRKAIGRVVDVREGNKDGEDFYYATIATDGEGFEANGNGRSPYKVGDEVTYVTIKPNEAVPAPKGTAPGPQGSGQIVECNDGSMAYHCATPYFKVLGKGDMRAPSASRVAQERMAVTREFADDIKEGALLFGLSTLDYARMIGLAD